MSANRNNNEQKRLQDLSATGIMDSLPEAAYDDIATLAAYICETPIAYISFIDETRQWYKSRINIPFSETTLNQALCMPTMQETELLHVPDMTLDPRFKDSPFVQDSKFGIRFYAGYPLINSEGSTLGTLCVIDSKKRRLNEQQKFALEALGRQVVMMLELKRVLNTSNELALYDTLTGLANRLLVHERLSQALSKATLDGYSCAVLFIDLDRFKAINDTLGHAAGDVVLQEIGRRLRSAVRQTDTVSRYGGDEFLVVLHNIKDATELTAIADLIRQKLEQPIFFEGNAMTIAASIGSSTFPEHAQTGEELIRRADSALYVAKRQGSGVHQEYVSIAKNPLA